MDALGVKFSPYTIVDRISQGSEPVVAGYDPSSAAQNAVIKENGLPETFIDLEGKLVYIVCQSTDYARDYVTSLAGDLESYGAGGIYLDVQNTLAPQLCYATNHGHDPADPENTRRRTDIVRAIHDQAVDPNFYVTSESVNEMYLGDMEIGMSQWTRNLLGVSTTYYPLFETVYHPYTRIGRLGVVLNFDTQKLPPLVSQLLARQTYAAHIFMGWTPFAGSLLNEDSLIDNAVAAPIWGLFIDTVTRYMDFLTDEEIESHVKFGQRLRDPELGVPTVDLSFLGILLQLLTVPYGPVQPAVYGSSWGDPDDGSIVLLLANWTDTIDSVFASQLTGTSMVTMDAAALGFDEMWFEEYDTEMACEVAATDVQQMCFIGGPQTYSMSYRPSDSGYTAKNWKVWRYTGSGDPVYLGKFKGNKPIDLQGTIASRSMEAYLLEPSN